MTDLIYDFLSATSEDITLLLGTEAETTYKWITVGFALIPLYFTCKCFCEIIRGMFGGARK